MTEEIMKLAEEKMKKAEQATLHQLQTLRTSRATPALIERIRVEAYGQMMNINQVATISTPEARTLLIQVWDKTLVSEVEKAIIKSDLGITPQTSATIIRLNFPPLTEERRKELVKIAKKEAEHGKVVVRNIRRDANEQIKKLEKEKKISEDEGKKLLDKIQKLTDKYVEEIEKIFQIKEKEIMEI